MDIEDLQLIPVGSFVVGCVRKNNYTLDAYLHTEEKTTLQEILKKYEEKRELAIDSMEETQASLQHLYNSITLYN